MAKWVSLIVKFGAVASGRTDAFVDAMSTTRPDATLAADGRA
jgi:hypothetical protein